MPEEPDPRQPDPNEPDLKRIGEIIREKMVDDEEFQEGQKSRFGSKEHKDLGFGSSWRTPNSDFSRDFDGKTAFRNTKDKGSPYDI